MTTPPSTVTAPPASPKRRVFDLLVIVAVACGLLGLAWQVARERGRVEEAPLESPLAGDAPSLPETPELLLTLPLEKFSMLLTRQHVEGDSERALAALDQQCREVLAFADEWVLSLAVSPEEQQLLDSLVGTEPLSGEGGSVVFRSVKDRPVAERKATLAQLFPLTQPTGRAGIRGIAPTGGSLTPALSPPVESSPKAVPIMREREQSPRSVPVAGALVGRRLICWGFILSDGAEGYTVWFALPRAKLPRSVAREGHTP